VSDSPNAASGIQTVAVLGSGVMGAGIAAHAASAGLDVLLLDIVPEGAMDRNQLASAAIARCLKTDPAPLMHRKHARRIHFGNFEDDLERAAQCDWVVEAVVERLDIKQALFQRLEAVRGSNTIVSSNTSTIPLGSLVSGLSAEFRQHFLITHFFNPPRYMRLLEIVQGADTTSDVVARMRTFGEVQLGKGVVVCHDTPGFIANRIGTYWIQTAIAEAISMGLDVEDADAILGAPFGIPKTGVFGLVDLVGLDLMPHIMASMSSLLPADDSMLAAGELPPVVARMIEQGYTGRKGKGGFYRLHRAGGTRLKEAVDLATGEYRAARNSRIPAVAKARKGGPQALMAHDSAAGQYALRVMAKTINYAASLLPEIADKASDVDAAMRLGYSWKQGPFELLDKIGPQWLGAKLSELGDAPAGYLHSIGEGKTYTADDGVITELLPVALTRTPLVVPEGQLSLAVIKRRTKPLLRNHAASLWDLGDKAVCLEFHTKMNAVEPALMAMIGKALKHCQTAGCALVIYNDADNFSVGANIGLLLFAANMAAWTQIEATVRQGQQALCAMKYAPVPVVGAPSGMALGGGCEILLHCDSVQAHAEAYMGLVEVGVGLVPGWGGCKELVLRWMHERGRPGGPMPAVSQVFECISTARVARSAHEAEEMKLLRTTDGITMNRDRLLADAKARALELLPNYTPPEPPAPVHLPGETGEVALGLAVQSFVQMGKATPHDQVVAGALARVLCGGDTDIVDAVDEQQLYDLECAALVSLAKHPSTLARVEHMLETGKPLRN